MNTAVINIRTPSETKAKAQKVARELGFSLSSLINGYLRQLVKTKAIHYDLKAEEPSQFLIQALRESEEERKQGQAKSFKNGQLAIAHLDKIINERN